MPIEADYLLEVTRAVEDARGRGAVQEAAAAWLTSGVAEYFAGGVALDQALHLSGVGIERASSSANRIERNRHLVRAARLCGGATPRERCARLAREIEIFETRVWPRWQKLPVPPETASALRVELFEAFRRGQPPRTAKGLALILD